MDDKELMMLYLKADMDDLEISIGRILATSGGDVYRAGTDDIEKIKEKVNLYYQRNIEKLKDIICEKLKLDKRLKNEKFDFNLEGAIIIAEILEESDFIPMPLSYPLLAVWLLRKKVYDLCK